MAQGRGTLGMFCLFFGPLQVRLLSSGQTIYCLELCPLVLSFHFLDGLMD